MSLLRLAFWLSLLVFLLPSDPQQQARLYATVAAVTQRAASFCDRNGQTCVVGAELWANFLRKAEFALRLVGDLVVGRPAPEPAPPPYPYDRRGSAGSFGR
jgi:hypothetical protein